MEKIYEIGKSFDIKAGIASDDEKLKFIAYPYTSSQIMTSSIVVFLVFLVGGFLLSAVFANNFFTFIGFFFGALIGTILYIYPTQIHYTKEMLDYQEEMLRALMRISNYILMETNLEFAIDETRKFSSGILKRQFNDIIERLVRKENNDLGQALETYLAVWNSINPIFVKSLRLLETASIADKEEREDIVKEAIEDVLMTYNTIQKRQSEDLSNNAKTLIAMGVLMPILMLMLLPVVTIFLPDLVTTSILVAVFNIIVPTMVLVFALQFSTKRIQVDTIKIRDSYEYKPLETWKIFVPIGIAVLFSIPTITYLSAIDFSTPSPDHYGLVGILMTWLMPLGMAIGILIFTNLYSKTYEKLWKNISDVEQDIPHMLQIFSTYLSLNIPLENSFTNIAEDYRTYGFGDHPTVMIFNKINHMLKTSKKTIEELVQKNIEKISSSVKFTQILNQIVSFSQFSLKTAGRTTKVMREQFTSLYKLNDYIRTLLADTLSFIRMTTSMLSPMLSAVSVIMAIGIVSFVTFMEEQMSNISKIGGGEGFKMQLIDFSNVIPPNILGVIVGVFVVEIIVVLSIFESNIEQGFDVYYIIKKIKSNMLGFFVFSAILFAGYWVMKALFFGSIMNSFE